VDEDLQRILMRGKKIIRRKKKSRGADWAQGDPPTMQEVHRGVWCRRCHVRHPYNGRDKLKTSFYKNDAGKWVILWLCPKSGDVVGDSSEFAGNTIEKDTEVDQREAGDGTGTSSRTGDADSV